MKTAKFRFIIVLFYFGLMHQGLACSCVNVPKTFMKYISVKHIIVSATVLDHIEIPGDSNPFHIYYGLTQLKVDHWFQNKMESDTIYYANGSGSMCNSSIARFEIGDQVILKANRKTSLDNLHYNPNPESDYVRFIKNYNQKPIIGYGICDTGLLTVKNDQVIGPSTKNHIARSYKLERFVGRISKSLAERMERIRRKAPPKLQSISLSKFSRLMKMKWNSLK